MCFPAAVKLAEELHVHKRDNPLGCTLVVEGLSSVPHAHPLKVARESASERAVQCKSRPFDQTGQPSGRVGQQ